MFRIVNLPDELLRFRPDDGASGGGNPNPADPPAGAQNADKPTGDDSPGKDEPAPVPYARFKEINDRLKQLEQEQRKAADAAAKAEEERLAKQQEWQQLADQRQAKLSELQPKAELADTLSQQLRAQIDAEIAKWPEEVTAMKPADDAPITAWMDWAGKARAVVAKLTEEKQPAGGNRRGPKPTGSGQRDAERVRETERKQTQALF